MTKQLHKEILKHLEGEVSRLMVAAFNKHLEQWPAKNTNDLRSIDRKLKQAEKNLSEFKKLEI